MKSRRKPGGQPGHPGHHRPLVPAARVATIIDLTPTTCRQCARRLHARDDVGEPRRHQVLGETFAGILGSDRLPSYLKYVVDQRQFC